MTSAAKGGLKMLTRGGGGGGSKPCRRQQKYLNFGKKFKSSVPIIMRETTALIYSPKGAFTYDVSKILPPLPCQR